MAPEVRDQGSCAGGAVKEGHSVQNQHNVFSRQIMSSAGRECLQLADNVFSWRVMSSAGG